MSSPDVSSAEMSCGGPTVHCMTQGQDDLRAVHAARRELGPAYDDALLDTFVDRAEAQLRARLDVQDPRIRRVGTGPAAAIRFQVSIGGPGLALIAGNIGWGLISTLTVLVERYNDGHLPRH